MAEKTGITWADHTFNPLWGCTKISPGCDNCYAAADSKRYGFDVWGKDAGRRTFSEKHWNEPRKWNAGAVAGGVRRRVFCASMGDVGETHAAWDVERPRLWQLIRETPALDWMILTKRPENLVSHLPADWGGGWPNVWLGVTVENDDYRWRIPKILRAPAAVHFLSIEPQIGPVDLRRTLAVGGDPRNRIDWVILGGESGGGARPYRVEWARDLIEQCQTNGVAVFNKQLGTVMARELHLTQRKGADPNEWPEDLRVQEFPKGAAAWTRSTD